MTQGLSVGGRTREYLHSYRYLGTNLILSLNALYRAVSKLMLHCDLQRTALIVCGFPNVKWRLAEASYEGGAQLGQEKAVEQNREKCLLITRAQE